MGKSNKRKEKEVENSLKEETDMLPEDLEYSKIRGFFIKLSKKTSGLLNIKNYMFHEGK